MRAAARITAAGSAWITYWHIYHSKIAHIRNSPNRGDSLIVQKGGVAAYTWMDRKVVMVMASNTQLSVIDSVLWRQKDNSRTPIPCPEFIILYNKYMGGVNRGDQLCWYYSCRTKSRKFYKYIFHFLFDVAITSSYILQKSFCSNSTIKNIKRLPAQVGNAADWRVLQPSASWA